MAKSTKPRAAFQIPTMQEVIKFMDKTMKDWPTLFCEFYANKFWNSYQSKGWEISRGVRMKDWKAAFFAQWKDVKYKEDREMLDKCLRSLTHRFHLDEQKRASAGMFAEQETVGDVKPFERVLQFLDGIQAAFFEGTATEAQLRNACETLRGWKMLRLRKEQIEKIVVDQGNNADFGKLLAIRAFFGNLKASGQTVSQFVKSKMEKA
jgi:hypothetical protein